MNTAYPEDLFIYMSLVQSETLIYTRRYVELLEQLTSEVLQGDSCRRYRTNVRSARIYQHIIELLSRYLERISADKVYENSNASFLFIPFSQ